MLRLPVTLRLVVFVCLPSLSFQLSPLDVTPLPFDVIYTQARQTKKEEKDT